MLVPDFHRELTAADPPTRACDEDNTLPRLNIVTITLPVIATLLAVMTETLAPSIVNALVIELWRELDVDPALVTTTADLMPLEDEIIVIDETVFATIVVTEIHTLALLEDPPKRELLVNIMPVMARIVSEVLPVVATLVLIWLLTAAPPKSTVNPDVMVPTSALNPTVTATDRFSISDNPDVAVFNIVDVVDIHDDALTLLPPTRPLFDTEPLPE